MRGARHGGDVVLGTGAGGFKMAAENRTQDLYKNENCLSSSTCAARRSKMFWRFLIGHFQPWRVLIGGA